ncbi:MAG: ribonuclease HI [Deltaproteobacteria bacterium]|nr:ribonuclease HI [Deltaproteobacteria bacterium]
MSEQPIVVFTDGAAKGNPGPGGWGVVIATPSGQVTELGGGAANTTNNQMELTAAIAALRRLRRTPGALAIHTDSTYLINGIREWIRAWRKRGWKTAEGNDVLNRELWEALASLVAARGKGGITWHYVRGHFGIPGNERVDEIANAYARKRHVDLYHGPLLRYPLPIFDVPEDTGVPRRAAGAATSSTGKVAAHSYLSVVDGKAMRHASWADCERRVKGRSGAKFKKAMSAADEAAILRAWGYGTEDL